MIERRLLTPLMPLFGLSLLVLGGLSLSLVLSQALFIIFGLVLFFLISRYPYDQHRLLLRPYLAISLVLLILPYLFGAVTRGASRWVPLWGLSLQPSELVKPLLIVVWSAYLARFKQKLTGKGLMVFIIMLALPFILVFKQPDLGTSLVLAAIWLGLLFSARISRWRLAGLLGLAVIIIPFFIARLQPYQKERLTSFLNPYADPAGSGYQVIQALIAVGGGGLFGQGLGQGSQAQLQFLPERQTDFIFSTLAEELGLVGAGTLILSYWWLFRRLMVIAKDSRDEFGRLLVTGVVVMLWFQAGVSLGMNLGMMPVTGITLPLVSAGGSSLLATMISLGLAASVWKFS